MQDQQSYVLTTSADSAPQTQQALLTFNAVPVGTCAQGMLVHQPV
jgi:hypothetical protein